MTSIYTHISPDKEYLRGILLTEEDWFVGYQIFSVQSFRVPTSKITDIFREHFKRIKEEFTVDDLVAAENSFTVGINQGVVQLEKEGKIIVNDTYQDITQCHGDNERVIYPSTLSRTNDGYTIFNHGGLPPPSTESLH